jgi:hypothetical protein
VIRGSKSKGRRGRLKGRENKKRSSRLCGRLVKGMLRVWI